MIYNNRNQSNDMQEKVRKKKKTVLMPIFSTVVKNHVSKIKYTSQNCMCEHEEVYKLEAFKLFNTILKPYAE